MTGDNGGHLFVPIVLKWLLSLTVDDDDDAFINCHIPMLIQELLYSR